MPPKKGEPWYTTIAASAKDKAFPKLLKIIRESPDSRDFYDILEKYPDLKDRQDKDGRTPLMYAAMSGHVDVMNTLIEYNKVDVTIRDKDGKDAADYFKEYATKEIKYLTDRYKDNDPQTLENEVGDIKSSQDYILKMIDDVKTEMTAKLAEPLTRVSTQFGKLTGDKKMDALALSLKSVSGQAGEPSRVVAEAREKLGRGRKTRKSRKGKAKGRKSRRV